MIRPKRLLPGARIGIVAPSSPIDGKAAFDRGLRSLEVLGLKPVIPKGLHRRWRFFAGNDQHRAAMINRMFADDSIDGLICMRGGDGAARVLPLLDYEQIKLNPKCIIGYSDVTALSMALWSRIRMVSFSGAMVANGWNTAGERTIDSFTSLVSGENDIEWRFDRGEFKVLSEGCAEGRLLGGNLTVLSGLTGSPYFPAMRGAVLFLEDVNEKPERIDRMLWNLKLAGKFDGVSAVLLGQFNGSTSRRIPDETLLNFVLKDHFSEMGVPVITNLPFGHMRDMLTIPVGIRVAVDTRRRTISILERAVA